MRQFAIYDWVGNLMFTDTFNDFDDAYGFLTLQVEEMYPDTVENEDRFNEEIGEYYIKECER